MKHRQVVASMTTAAILLIATLAVSCGYCAGRYWPWSDSVTSVTHSATYATPAVKGYNIDDRMKHMADRSMREGHCRQEEHR